MLERDIEAEVCDYAESRGLEQRKFKTPNRRNAPDRIFFVQGGLTFFIEFKATGKKPTKGQLREHERLRDYGFCVYVIDDIDTGKRVIDQWTADTRRVPLISIPCD